MAARKRAVEHELERECLIDYLDELHREFGPVPVELIDEYDGLWPLAAQHGNVRIASI